MLTSFSIGLDTPERMQAKAAEAGAYRVLKVKLGGDQDEAIIRALRAVTDKPLRVDVNEAWRMPAVARAHGLDAMLGCMIESSVAISAAVQLQSLARWLDLDGNLLLRADPYAGPEFREGRWWPSDRPGLGVVPVR